MPANSNDLLTSQQNPHRPPPAATEPQQAQVDLRELAEKVLALLKEELRLERERLARK